VGPRAGLDDMEKITFLTLPGLELQLLCRPAHSQYTFTIQAEKFKQTLFARKLMATVFWDRRGVLMVEFMQ
jgi:hypothetical protein